MRSNLSARLLSVFAILVILLISCGSSTNLQEKIIGNWEIQAGRKFHLSIGIFYVCRASGKYIF